jgi:hypothetical protein
MNAGREGKVILLLVSAGNKKKTDKLICKEEDGLEREMPVADLEEIFQGGSEEIDDHDVIVALLAGVHDPGNTWPAHERLVDLRFLAEGGRERAGDGWLELDSDFFAGDGVHAEEDGAWGMHEMAACARTRYEPQPPLAISSSSLYLPPNMTSIGAGGRGRQGLWFGFWFRLCKTLMRRHVIASCRESCLFWKPRYYAKNCICFIGGFPSIPVDVAQNTHSKPHQWRTCILIDW